MQAMVGIPCALSSAARRGIGPRTAYSMSMMFGLMAMGDDTVAFSSDNPGGVPSEVSRHRPDRVNCGSAGRLGTRPVEYTLAAEMCSARRAFLRRARTLPTRQDRRPRMQATVQCDTARLHLEVRGAGEPVILVHGGPGIYDYLSGSAIGHWLSEEYTVVGYDQRGCRHSPSEGPFTVDANIGDLESIRRHLGVDRAKLVAHSWGGLLALCYAAAHPDRLAGLVLVGSIGPRKPWERAFWDRLDLRYTPAQRGRLAEIDDQIAHTRDRARRAELYRRRYNVVLPSYFAPGREDLAFEIESFSRLVGVNTMANMHRSRYGAPGWEVGFTKVTAPVTIVHGRQDPVPWRVVEDVEDLLPRAEVVPLEDCGHFPWLEVPEEFGAALARALRAE